MVRHETTGDVVNVCFKSSFLWKHVRVRHLTEITRIKNSGDDPDFANLLLNIGDGRIPTEKHLGQFKIKIPQHLIVQDLLH